MQLELAKYFFCKNPMNLEIFHGIDSKFNGQYYFATCKSPLIQLCKIV